MNSHSNFRSTLLSISTSAALFAALSVFAEDLKPIFNGKDLDGWVIRGGTAGYKVEDGVIIGSSKGGANTFLCTEKEYGDFILELEIKADEGLNSGVQIRSHCYDHATTYEWGPQQIKIPANRVHGYQAEVDNQPSRRWSGGVYEEGRRGWLYPLDKPKDKVAGQAYKFGEWNKYRIECMGDSIKTWVNGVPVADLIDSETLTGFIALQVHGTQKEGLQVRFKNIRLRDLGRHIWKSVWNGKDLSTGHVIGKGDWKVEDGAIHGTHPKTEKEFGHLVSNDTRGDFVLRLKYKSVKGNSGLYFHIDETGASGVSGFQAEIDPEKDAGGLYETNGREWVSKPSPEDVKKSIKPREWNTMTVHSHGKRITTNVNGHRMAEVFDDPGRTEGHFAFQLHGNQDVDVFFKDIEILVEE
jgi:hypothetical protein